MQSTSALEGTFAPFATVLESNLEDRGQLSLAVLEILNYVAAAEQAFEWIEDRRFTTGLMGELQRTLVRGTAGEHSDAGGLRDRQVFIGAEGVPIDQARFVPAPHGDQLTAAFEAWIRWVNRADLELPPVVQAGLAHYQFETLHPYSDGNGRIGRRQTGAGVLLLRGVRLAEQEPGWLSADGSLNVVQRSVLLPSWTSRRSRPRAWRAWTSWGSSG